MPDGEKIVFCTGGGCTAKLGAGALSRILEKLPRGEKDPATTAGTMQPFIKSRRISHWYRPWTSFRQW